MAIVTHSKSSRAARKSARGAHPPDLTVLLGRFCEALAVIETACRAQELSENHTDETVTLRVGLKMLNGVYTELDRAILLRCGFSPHRTNSVGVGPQLQ